MKKLMLRALVIALLLPVFSAYSQTNWLNWTLGSTPLGLTAGVAADDFQIQILGHKDSGVIDVFLTTSVPVLTFTVNANQWPDGNVKVLSSVTKYDGTPVISTPMIGFTSFDLQADEYKFYGTDFCVNFAVSVGTVDYATANLCYVYTAPGIASLTAIPVGIEDVKSESKTCNIIVNGDKVIIELGDRHKHINDASVSITDVSGKTLYNESRQVVNGLIDGIDIPGNGTAGLYIINVYGEDGRYCSGKFFAD